MSFRVTEWVWKNGPTEPTERLVLLALASFADDDGKCWPGVGSIAEMAAMSDRGVRGVLRRLEAQGWVETVPNRGRGNSNLYRIPCVPVDKTGTENRNSMPVSAPENRNVTTQNRNVTTLKPEPRSAEPVRNLSRTKKDPPTPQGGQEIAIARRKTRIAADAILSDRHREIATAKGLTDAEAEAQFLRFRDWACAKGQAYVDWDAAWRNWITSPHFKPITGGGHAPKRADDKLSAFIAGARR